ncbi:MAG: 5-(carboxyamino)imidazole ribonucleotide synthase [Actinobacteria bacterium]|nr:5-(carboxyamino)imidazole ribonucleotide synthase [Actinomycetota bacterium]
MTPRQSTPPIVGVIGGGQLARMMAAPAGALGIHIRLLAESAHECATEVIADVVVGDFRDYETLKTFVSSCDVVTFDHEHVPNALLRRLASEGMEAKLQPGPNALQYAQEKVKMRELVSPDLSPRWKQVSHIDEARDFGFPLVAKSLIGGYDGKGVWRVESEAELSELLRHGGLLLEELVPFDAEISVLVARSPHGQAAVWAVTETIQENGICVQTVTPASQLSDELAGKAQSIALKIAEQTGVVGVMAVEMFVVGERLLVNELAMRPHNSGHWSIEGAITSQFEQHLRAVLDLPLGATEMRARHVVMGNILGGDKADLHRAFLHLFARDPGLKVHLYGKEVRLGRKVGHVTLLGEDAKRLRARALHATEFFAGRVGEHDE